jgi:hypothetical protein
VEKPFPSSLDGDGASLFFWGSGCSGRSEEQATQGTYDLFALEGVGESISGKDGLGQDALVGLLVLVEKLEVGGEGVNGLEIADVDERGRVKVLGYIGSAIVDRDGTGQIRIDDLLGDVARLNPILKTNDKFVGAIVLYCQIIKRLAVTFPTPHLVHEPIICRCPLLLVITRGEKRRRTGRRAVSQCIDGSVRARTQFMIKLVSSLHIVRVQKGTEFSFDAAGGRPPRKEKILRP